MGSNSSVESSKEEMPFKDNKELSVNSLRLCGGRGAAGREDAADPLQQLFETKEAGKGRVAYDHGLVLACSWRNYSSVSTGSSI
ncbi:hypothetical protein LWI29_000738 [Acer saccharum]|uniref:Uncharacterized protein n=1 Tax=Acer saccharum TaxID=4024 RepID=A0AA39SZ08_ACESA|nr:hypothetical protein LWI29_000738 [Acer saccharum]